MNNDETLVRKFKHGDKGVYKEIIESYKPYVYTICISVLKNKEDSEDVTQEVFVKIYFSLKKFKGSSSFKTWIYKITYNSCLTFLKKRNRKFLVDENANSEGIEDETEESNSFFEKSDRENKLDILRASMIELKPVESLVLTLFYLKEQSVKEIGEITSLSNSNIKTILHRGRNNLLQKCNSKLNRR